MKKAVILSSILIQGCLSGPNYTPPVVTVAESFGKGEDVVGIGEKKEDGKWWEGFEDLELSALIQEALKENPTVAIAEAHLRGARAGRRENQLELLPGAAVVGDYQRNKLSKLQAPGIENRDQSIFEAGFDAAWELDLFGRLRRQVESSEALEEASQAEVFAAQQAVVAEVVKEYILLRSSQKRFLVAKQNLIAQQSTAKLTERQFQLGLVTEFDAASARAQVARTESALPTYQGAVEQHRYALAVLTGNEPHYLEDRFGELKDLPEFKRAIGLDNPEIMLQRRPDVIQAERILASTTAQVGVAVGEYFPKVRLLGSLTYEADTFKKLTSSPTQVFSVGPSLKWRILEARRVGEGVELARAQVDEALAQYRTVALNALNEVEQGLSQLRALQAQSGKLQESFQASMLAARIARKQYEAGAIELITMLDAERKQLESEDALVDSSTKMMISLVAVIKALGVPV